MNIFCICSGGIYCIELKSLLVYIHESIFQHVICTYAFDFFINLLYIGGLISQQPTYVIRFPMNSPSPTLFPNKAQNNTSHLFLSKSYKQLPNASIWSLELHLPTTTTCKYHHHQHSHHHIYNNEAHGDDGGSL